MSELFKDLLERMHEFIEYESQEENSKVKRRKNRELEYLKKVFSERYGE